MDATKSHDDHLEMAERDPLCPGQESIQNSDFQSNGTTSVTFPVTYYDSSATLQGNYLRITLPKCYTTSMNDNLHILISQPPSEPLSNPFTIEHGRHGEELHDVEVCSAFLQKHYYLC